MLALSVTALVYATGGTKYVYVQLMYLPVLLSGLLFNARVAFWFGILAGLMMGPLMPLEVAENIYQPTEAWLFRILFFCLNGVCAGAVSGLLRHRIRLLEKVKTEIAMTYGRTLRALVVLIGERDDETADHCEQVAYNAVCLGEALALSDERIEVLYWSALLHDLGKVGIPEAILNKPGPLTPEERLEMQRHVDIGYRVILQASSEFAPIADVVAGHHERMDGTGYPKGLRAEQILIESRILSVIDVFEALTSVRPYHQAMTPEAALLMMQKESGRQFDARVLETFMGLLRRGEVMTTQDVAALERVKDRYHGDGLFLSKLKNA